MARANLITKSGSKVTIEGSHEEVAALIERIDGASSPKTPAAASSRRPRSTAKPTLVGLIGELIDGGFFKKPKGLGAIKIALEESGHFYPVTTLSPAVLRLVRKKSLRRIKDKKRWLYVG